jgi:16S rRNA G527 N7-methylase RsmG
MREVLRERIESDAEGLGLRLEDTTWSKIEQLGELWAKYGVSMNLSGARTPDEIGAHALEGLQAVECGIRSGVLEAGKGWLDVGSGAGFPGLVAVASTRCAITLVEPRSRRAAFLELALATIGARDCRVFRGRLHRSTWQRIGDDGDIEPQKRFYAIASARGVFRPRLWLEEAEAWVRSGGIVLVHLTRGAEDPDGREPVARVDGPRWSVRAYSVG